MTRAGGVVGAVNGLRQWRAVRGRGPVCLVPSPGWGMSVDLYLETLAPLEERFTLVYIDSRGCGLSEAPGSSKEYRYKDFAADLEGARRALGMDKVWVLGHSMAGIQAMRYGLDFPHSTAGLILVATFAEGDKEYSEEVSRREELRSSEAWYRKVDWGSILTDEDLAGAFRTALPLYFQDADRIPEYRAALASTTFRGHAYRGWLDSEGGTVSMLAEMSGLKCPMCLIVGEDDFVCAPRNSERIREHAPQARLTVLPKTGHFPWLEAPTAFYAAVDGFLDEFPASAH